MLNDMISHLRINPLQIRSYKICKEQDQASRFKRIMRFLFESAIERSVREDIEAKARPYIEYEVGRRFVRQYFDNEADMMKFVVKKLNVEWIEATEEI